MLRITIIFLYCLVALQGVSQSSYPIGHSHNDYKQILPFLTAFSAKMGSIEADVFLRGNTLCVAHTSLGIDHSFTLDELYIQPIVAAVRSGKIYPLQFLIDVKSDKTATLNAIVNALAQFPDVFNECSEVTVVISGNRPPASEWQCYPPYIFFDGRPNELYTQEEWSRIGIVSDNFKKYISFLWRRHNKKRIQSVITACHNHGKKFRFWRTPDNEHTWKWLLSIGADCINTDKPRSFRAFFENTFKVKTTAQQEDKGVTTAGK